MEQLYLGELREMFKIEDECASRGHPYRELIASYNGRDVVLVQCSNCGALYERNATPKERQEHWSVMDIEFILKS